MEPTDHNRRAFDDAHRTAENVLAAPGMPERIRERLRSMTSARQVCEDLMQDALDGGGKDNITVVVRRAVAREG